MCVGECSIRLLAICRTLVGVRPQADIVPSCYTRVFFSALKRYLFCRLTMKTVAMESPQRRCRHCDHPLVIMGFLKGSSQFSGKQYNDTEKGHTKYAHWNFNQAEDPEGDYQHGGKKNRFIDADEARCHHHTSSGWMLLSEGHLRATRTCGKVDSCKRL